MFEFCETDLESILMEQTVVLKPEHIKCHMKMLLEGIGYLHRNFVLHRVSRNCLFFRFLQTRFKQNVSHKWSPFVYSILSTSQDCKLRTVCEPRATVSLSRWCCENKERSHFTPFRKRPAYLIKTTFLKRTIYLDKDSSCGLKLLYFESFLPSSYTLSDFVASRADCRCPLPVNWRCVAAFPDTKKT